MPEKKSIKLSLDWAKRSKKEFGCNPKKALFGIVQGGIYKDLREESLDGLIKLNFDAESFKPINKYNDHINQLSNDLKFDI